MEGCRASYTTGKAFPQFCLVSFLIHIFTRKILCAITDADIGKVNDITITFCCCPSKLPSSRCPAILPACLHVLEVQDSDLPFRLLLLSMSIYHKKLMRKKPKQCLNELSTLYATCNSNLFSIGGSEERAPCQSSDIFLHQKIF